MLIGSKSKILLKIILCLNLGLNLAGADIIVGINSGYEPYEFIDKEGNLVGFDVDLMNEICQELNEKCTYIDVPFSHLGAQLKLGQFTAIISSIAITEARKKQFAFTESYNNPGIVLLATQQNLNDFTAFDGKTVGVPTESQHKMFLNAEHPKINTESFDSMSDAILALDQGKIQGVFIEEPTALGYMKRHPAMFIVGEPIYNESFFGIGEGIAVNKNNTALRDRINAALEKIKASGRHQELYDKWFIK